MIVADLILINYYLCLCLFQKQSESIFYYDCLGGQFLSLFHANLKLWL